MSVPQHPQMTPGRLITHWQDRIGGPLIIDHADPVIECSADFLVYAQCDGHVAAELSGDLVTFRGANKDVIYRVCEHDGQRDVYTLRWPD